MVLDGLNRGCRGSSDTGEADDKLYTWINPQVIQGWSVNSEFPPGKGTQRPKPPNIIQSHHILLTEKIRKGKRQVQGLGLCRLLDPTGAMTRPSRLTLCFPSCWHSFSTGWLSFCQFAFSLHSISHHCHARSFYQAESLLQSSCSLEIFGFNRTSHKWWQLYSSDVIHCSQTQWTSLNNY